MYFEMIFPTNHYLLISTKSLRVEYASMSNFGRKLRTCKAGVMNEAANTCMKNSGVL